MAIERNEHNALLAKFWGNIQNRGDRLQWLRKAADWKVESTSRYIDVRRGSSRLPKADGVCFCCQRRPATSRHHIIQIQNGGRNITKNIVSLCASCHRAVHPWMKKRKAVAAEPFDATPRLVK